MEGSVARRKKRKTSSNTNNTNTNTDTPNLPNNVSFENLPRETRLEIYRRLSEKELSRAMCVSKPWRDLIILHCLPTIAPTALNYLGLLLRVETHTNYQRSSGLSMVFNEPNDEFITFGSYPFLRLCSKIMQCKVTSQMLLDACNGLLLFCHRDGNFDTHSYEFYYYYVINPITKQCISVLKLAGPKTARFMYAALAYDPSESSYFKIVQFQGSHQLNIFSSETCEWTTLKSQLPLEVTRGTWEKKSIYYRGALYRLSDSGHVVKFLVHPQEKVGDQAVAIKLPGAFSRKNKYTIRIRNNQITYASISESFMVIWELGEDSVDIGSESTYNWSLLNKGEYKNTLEALNVTGQVLAIHPHLNMVLLKGEPYMFCYHYPDTRMTIRKYSTSINGWATAFPLYECPIPFTCCLNKMNNGTFQRISIPTPARRRN